MAESRNIRPDKEGDGLDGVELNLGFRLASNQTAEDYLAIGDELLRGEGINPLHGLGKSPQDPKQ
jgi:hypothetical protein